MRSRRIALCIGHSRKGDAGAVSTTDPVMNEWRYNSSLAELVKEELDSAGATVEIFDDYKYISYSAAMNYIADEVERWQADVALELHFNSAHPTARGFEYLHWYKSRAGRILAKCFVDAQADEFTWQKNRGAKARRPGTRGSQFLRKTHCPALILEPFFGSNKNEWAYFSQIEYQLDLAHCYAQALRAYFSRH